MYFILREWWCISVFEFLNSLFGRVRLDFDNVCLYKFCDEGWKYNCCVDWDCFVKCDVYWVKRVSNASCL